MNSPVLVLGLLLLAAIVVAGLPLWRSGQKNAALAVSGFISVAAVVLYLFTGSPQGVDVPARSATATTMQATQETPPTAPNVEQMVANLAAKLDENPEDREGWIMLGRSYFVLGRYGQSAEAYGRAMALSEVDDPELMANYAEGLVLDDQANLNTVAAPVFERVLELDGDQAKGLWYSSVAAMERGENDLARQRLEHLLSLDPPAEFRDVIQARLDTLNGE